MRLRPHHLLCTQGYSGKGYSEAFVEHMTDIVDKLRGKEPVKIELVFGTDDLCKVCPHKLGENRCQTQDKVLYFDRKVVELFKLEEGQYIYQDLIEEIDSKMTEEMIDEICGACSWYPISACKKNVCKHIIGNRAEGEE